MVLFFLSLSLDGSTASIWIKNVQSYGPSATVVGVKCLSTLTRYYFKEKTLTRARDMVVSYNVNLTTPADNIQRLFLKWLHNAIVVGEIDEYLLSLF